MESIINKKAQEIYQKYFITESSDPSLDPLTLLMIAKILIEVGIYIYKCRNGKEKTLVSALIKRPGIGEILLLTKIVRKHTKGTNINSRKLKNVILSMDFSNDLENMLEEVKNVST